MRAINPLFKEDFYKVGHQKMYAPGTTKIYSNLTPRKSRIEGINHVVAFAIQPFLADLKADWEAGFFQRPWAEVEAEYVRMISATLGPDAAGTDHLKKLHDLGYLPLHIKALPEGSIVPIRVPLLTITNTVDHAFWLVNFLESFMSAQLWQGMTSITIAHEFFKMLRKNAIETAGSPDFVPWQGHDFSFRGMSSLESACLSGAGHLAAGFTGTDTIPAIQFLEHYYGADVTKELVGASVPATEHSIMCLGGVDDEIGTFRRLLSTFPKGILSVVSDTWSLPSVVCNILPVLKAEIMGRDGKLVIRPDSFWTDPVDCLCGFDGYHPQMEKMTPKEVMMVRKGLVESLWDLFGGTTTAQGFKVLDSHIGCIYGDAITFDRAKRICERLRAKGFASINEVFGIGSYTYQYNTRDTFSFAVKATYGVVNGEPREIFKDPITDDGMKKSSKGLLRVDGESGSYTVKDCCTIEEERGGALQTVFANGELVGFTSLSAIRARLTSQLK